MTETELKPGYKCGCELCTDRKAVYNRVVQKPESVTLTKAQLQKALKEVEALRKRLDEVECLLKFQAGGKKCRK
jgi:hypothetical protein